MSVHKINMFQPSKAVLHSDVTFEIFSDHTKLGEMKISKGNVEWTPPNSRTSRPITWERFSALMNAQYQKKRRRGHPAGMPAKIIDADDGDADDNPYTRDELEAMSLAQLKTLAKEGGWTAADLRGLDKDSIVDGLLGTNNDDDDADNDADDDDADADDDGDADVLDEDALAAMSLADVKEVAKAYGVKVTRGMKQDDVVAEIMELAEDE